MAAAGRRDVARSGARTPSAACRRQLEFGTSEALWPIPGAAIGDRSRSGYGRVRWRNARTKFGTFSRGEEPGVRANQSSDGIEKEKRDGRNALKRSLSTAALASLKRPVSSRKCC